jgi:heme/copper-type cytochrome/quinol oxidase subunit 3
MLREDRVTSVVDVVTDEVEGGVPSLVGEPPLFSGPPFGEDRFPSSPGPRPQPPVSNARLGMLVFLGFESMFFAGLIGAFLVFRLGSPFWPPMGRPRLPLLVTLVNTAFLLSSGFTMRSALRAIRKDDRQGLATGLTATALIGAIFLAVQGSEWVRLIRHGLTLSAGIYGATFYTLIGCHAVHVLGAVVWLLIVLIGARGNRFSARNHVAVDLCGMYWYFVIAIWPILFTLVYLK